MSNQAEAGHGGVLSLELDPVGAPGVFTDIAELNGDVMKPELSRPETETTPHNKTIDYWVTGALRRGQISGTVNTVFGDGTHDHVTGMIKKIMDNVECGFRIRGPGGSANTDEVIGSGFFQLVGPDTMPVREGARTMPFAIRLSGPMIYDGVTFGN